MGVEAHSLERVVHAARRDELIERHLGRRTDPPLFELGAGVDHLVAKKADGREVLTDLRLDDRGIEALAGVIIDEQRAVRPLLGPEEAGRRVAQNVIFTRGDIEADNVRYAGVVAVPQERLAVWREGEILRHRRR